MGDMTPERKYELAKIAEEKYCSNTDDIEIDELPNFSEAEDGIWVQAWVWLTKEEMT